MIETTTIVLIVGLVISLTLNLLLIYNTYRRANMVIPHNPDQYLYDRLNKVDERSRLALNLLLKSDVSIDTETLANAVAYN